MGPLLLDKRADILRFGVDGWHARFNEVFTEENVARMADALATTIGAQLLTSPLQLLMQTQIALWAVPANLLVAPWMDMDPNATFRGDPLAYLLANAPDTPFAGLESDRWIIGGAQ